MVNEDVAVSIDSFRSCTEVIDFKSKGHLRNFAIKLSIYFDFLIIALCFLMLMIFGKDLYSDFSLPQVRLTWFLFIICGVFIICLTRHRLKNIFKKDK